MEAQPVVRIKAGHRVRVTDRASLYYGRVGTVTQINSNQTYIIALEPATSPPEVRARPSQVELLIES